MSKPSRSSARRWRSIVESLGEDHSQTACAYFNLAYNLFVRRKFVEAEQLHRKALAIRLKVLDPKQASSINRIHKYHISILRSNRRTFYLPRSRPPFVTRWPPSLASFPFLCSAAPTDRGIRTPTSCLNHSQHNQQPCSRSASRRKTSCHGFHESKR